MRLNQTGMGDVLVTSARRVRSTSRHSHFRLFTSATSADPESADLCQTGCKQRDPERSRVFKADLRAAVSCPGSSISWSTHELLLSKSTLLVIFKRAKNGNKPTQVKDCDRRGWEVRSSKNICEKTVLSPALTPLNSLQAAETQNCFWEQVWRISSLLRICTRKSQPHW